MAPPAYMPERQGLWDPAFEHDACGIGFVANIGGRKSHEIIQRGLQVLVNLTHRGAAGADPETGDGAGILMQIPHRFLLEVCAPLQIRLPHDYLDATRHVGERCLRPGACDACFDPEGFETTDRQRGFRLVVSRGYDFRAVGIGVRESHRLREIRFVAQWTGDLPSSHSFAALVDSICGSPPSHFC